MDKSREERRLHLKLDEPCMERGGNSTMFRGLLADFLGTEIFVKKSVVLCHACHNGACSNKLHMYWGTYRDNIQDAKENGTWKGIFAKSVEKYGLEKALQMNRENLDHRAGGAGNKGIPKSEEHKKKVSEGLRRYAAAKKVLKEQ